MSRLTETVKTRVEPELREQIESEAQRQERTPASLLRRYVREGIERDLATRGQSQRV